MYEDLGSSVRMDGAVFVVWGLCTQHVVSMLCFDSTVNKIWGMVPCVYKVYTLRLFHCLLEILAVLSGSGGGIKGERRQMLACGVGGPRQGFPCSLLPGILSNRSDSLVFRTKDVAEIFV